MDGQPINSALYQAGPKAVQFEKQEIGRMIAMDVIEPDQTELASLIVFVSKKDGTLRFCVDCRKLNAVKICHSYLIKSL